VRRLLLKLLRPLAFRLQTNIVRLLPTKDRRLLHNRHTVDRLLFSRHTAHPRLLLPMVHPLRSLLTVHHPRHHHMVPLPDNSLHTVPLLDNSPRTEHHRASNLPTAPPLVSHLTVPLLTTSMVPLKVTSNPMELLRVTTTAALRHLLPSDSLLERLSVPLAGTRSTTKALSVGTM